MKPTTFLGSIRDQEGLGREAPTSRDLHSQAALFHEWWSRFKDATPPPGAGDGVYGLPTFDPTQIDPFTRNIDTKAIYKRLSDSLQSWPTQGKARP